jgi:hypothetical protein
VEILVILVRSHWGRRWLLKHPVAVKIPGGTGVLSQIVNKKFAAAHLRSYIASLKLFGVLLLVVGPLCAQTDRANLNEGFDTPVKKTFVDLSPSPYYRPAQHVREKLTCYYYSTRAVKQYDEGQKGAEWLSIVPSAQAACTSRHGKHEKVYTSAEWSGYLRGVKDTVAFFDAADGEDGGMPFVAFDVGAGRKLFEDSSLLDHDRKTLHLKTRSG